MSTSTKRSAFMRLAAAVADFGDPFYAEERQRDVWNEDSAFGLQLLLWGVMVLAGIMLWVGGRPLLPYSVAVLAVAAVISYLVIAYARAKGVRVPWKSSVTKGRLVAVAVVVTALTAGAARAAAEGNSGVSWLISAVPLGLGAVVGLALGARRDRRRREQASARGEVAPAIHPGL